MKSIEWYDALSPNNYYDYFRQDIIVLLSAEMLQNHYGNCK